MVMLQTTDVATEPPPVWESAATSADVFDTLYREEFPRLAGALYAMSGVRSLAEEVAQDTFAHAWSRWSRVQNGPSPAGWVYTTGFRLLRRRMRQRRLLLASLIRRSTDPAERIEERIDLVHALRSLPAPQLHVVILRHLLGLSTFEVAERLGTSEAAVRSALHRGVGALRSTLDTSAQGGSDGR